MDAGHMMKVNAEGFSGHWVVGCERMRKVEDNFKESGLSNGTMVLLSAEMGKAVNGAGFGGRLGIQF